MMFRVTSVRCFLLVIVFLNLVVLTNACDSDGTSCTSNMECCGYGCCSGTCQTPCRFGPGKRGRLQEFFQHR
uniref:I-superfamily Sr11.3 conotoxin n=1 Tax=Conus spurius TaxID=192919 RepID=D0V1X5_CONSP|nr:I-superfamily Sr11.3 conotoxin precursor [Conus spurius]